MRKEWCLALAITVWWGCSSFDESYIVKVTTGKYGDQLEPAQFYRYRVSGYSWLQRTEFQCGWYDKDAVDQLFSEVVAETSARNVETGGAQPASAALKKIGASPPTFQQAPYRIMGPGGESFDASNRRFVMIAANNPKVVAQQISQLANNKQLAAAFASVVQGSSRAENSWARTELAAAIAAHTGVSEVTAAAVAELNAMLADTGNVTPTAIHALIQRMLDSIPVTGGQ